MNIIPTNICTNDAVRTPVFESTCAPGFIDLQYNKFSYRIEYTKNINYVNDKGSGEGVGIGTADLDIYKASEKIQEALTMNSIVSSVTDLGEYGYGPSPFQTSHCGSASGVMNIDKDES